MRVKQRKNDASCTDKSKSQTTNQLLQNVQTENEPEELLEKEDVISRATSYVMENKVVVKHEGNTKPERRLKNANWLLSGIAGGCIVILVLYLMAIWRPEFRHSNYYVYDDPSILNELLSTKLSPSDSVAIKRAVKEEAARRNDLLEDLLDQRVVVSSDTFASNISSYYNTLIGVLSAILIILNLVGYFSWRSNANYSLEQKQKELEEAIDKIDDRMEKNIEEILRKNQVVKERFLSYLRDLLEQRETLTEDEWDKLHLLLKQYEKQEYLKAIDDENDDKNDGEIEG